MSNDAPHSECIGPDAPISFECIRGIIADVRSGTIGVATIRKVLLQLDRGFALVSPNPGETGVFNSTSTDEEAQYVVNQMDDLLKSLEENSTAQDFGPIFVNLLIQLLLRLLKDL